MNAIGIMQGRLSPPSEGRIQCFPVATWKDEFALAREAGLACIEWIYEASSELSNPLREREGIAEILKLSKNSGVEVRSVCADYYMTHYLIDRSGVPQKENFEHLRWLVGQVSFLGAHHMVIPFVDSSSLKLVQERWGLVSSLLEVADIANGKGVQLHLEADLTPVEFVKLLSQMNHPFIKVNYDIGNSASLGYDPREELSLLSPWLGSVHVKDRVLGGGTVPLGRGDADFPTCFRLFFEADFQGPFILQAAREEKMSEVALAIQNRKFIEQQVLSVLNGVL